MINNTLLFRLVLLVSCAHAMVHLLEQSIASVEQVISRQFQLSLEQSGLLGTAFRFPYGLGAILAGMLADRVGTHRVLAIYLSGAALTCLSFLATTTPLVLYGQLLILGCFASMYHPAGLALLANSTTVSERTRALGMHGVFGSTGIAAAPFLAGVTLSLPHVTWKGYYFILAIMCGVLAWLVATRLRSSAPLGPPPSPAGPVGSDPLESSAEQEQTASDVRPIGAAAPLATAQLQRLPFAALVLSSATSGIVYGGFLHFLKRYLSEVPELGSAAVGDLAGRDATASYFAAIVLICGAVSQFLTGRLAKPAHLPQLLSLAYASNAPFLLWMSVAEGTDRLTATCLLAFAHFTNQPLYNSLLPEFIPPQRRSTWFGFSNMMGFGVGAVGPWLVGSFGDYRQAYVALAGLSLVAAAFPAIVWLSPSVRAQRQGG